jgi:hypothetical protein
MGWTLAFTIVSLKHLMNVAVPVPARGSLKIYLSAIPLINRPDFGWSVGGGTLLGSLFDRGAVA